MPEKIKLQDLSKKIVEICKESTEETIKQTWEAAENAARTAVEDLRKNSPKRTGEYSKNWTYTKQNDGYVIHQKGKTYRLTHLLEKGHAKAGGGRVKGYPHIAPEEKKAVAEYLSDVERRIQK